MSDDAPPLTTKELHDLWSTLPDDRRLHFLASLQEDLADGLLSYQMRLAEVRLKTRPVYVVPPPPQSARGKPWSDRRKAAERDRKDRLCAMSTSETGDR